MPIWPTRSITEQGAINLTEWRVLELHDGDRHLIGYCIENYEGRVSSTVLNLELKTLQATTKSGRLYLLNGDPGHNSDASYVWEQWAYIHSLETWIDVTDSVWTEHLAHRSKKTLSL